VYDSKLALPFISHPESNPVVELNNWLINAFNGEWLRTANAKPLRIDIGDEKKKRAVQI
jgi:hypothetical protein